MFEHVALYILLTFGFTLGICAFGLSIYALWLEIARMIRRMKT